ncbi:BTAD domain-containing putative transcriptional regulator [Lentzea sp. NPDC092896]|uniref:AfsR/SARP family transcriptional regulator n=1 Tax=Lentzea sp. NPDC092896 TaxID=3364127 RepID=UPI003816AB80
MKVKLFGPVGVEVRGHEVDLGPARQRTVLAVLAASAGHPVHKSALIDRVWDGNPPNEVNNVVYTYVARLRRQLRMTAPQLTIERKAGGYVLSGPLHVDLHEFGLLLRMSPAVRTPDAVLAARLDEALRLSAEPLLADLTGTWVVQLRESAARQRVTALMQWTDVQVRLGNTEEPVNRLQDALSAQPLAEPLVGRLMVVLRHNGRNAEALDCYQTARRRMIDAVGAEPGPELRGLYQSILRTA